MDWLKRKKLAKEASAPRGKVEDKEEAREWRRKSTFTHLPKKGQEAFFCFLCGGEYPEEDKDIGDVDSKAKGMNTKSRKYQFWLQCEQLQQFSKFFKDYVTDEDMRFKEVDECFDGSRSEYDSLEDFLSRKKTDAENTQSFIIELQTKIKPILDTCFGEFKDKLKEQFGD